MSQEALISLIMLAVVIVVAIVGIIVALVRGEIKEFAKEKMVEAEELYKDLPKPEKSQKKLEYVIKAVKEKYKISDLIINITKFIKKTIEFINEMKGKK